MARQRLIYLVFIGITYLMALPLANTLLRVKIGLIVPYEAVEIGDTMKSAEDYINRILFADKINVSYSIVYANISDPVDNVVKGCKVMQDGVIAVIGPLADNMVEQLQWIFSSVHIPNIAPLASDVSNSRSSNFQYLIRLVPPHSVMVEAVASIFTSYGWNKAALLGSDTNFGIKSLTEFTILALKNRWKILNFELFSIMSNTSTDVTLDDRLKRIKTSGARIVILAADSRQAMNVINKANKLSMLESGWAWILLVDVADKDGFKLAFPVYSDGLLVVTQTAGKGQLYDDVIGRYPNLQPILLKYFDAALAIAYAVNNLLDDGVIIQPEGMNCIRESVDPWQHGKILLKRINYVLSAGNEITYDSVSKFPFASSLYPPNAAYEIFNFHYPNWIKVGKWTNVQRLFLDKNNTRFLGQSSIISDSGSAIFGKHLIVTTVIEEPFMMKNNKTGKLSGFLVELLEQLSLDLGFTYTLQFQEDGQYGIPELTSDGVKWSGMVGSLMRREVDLAVAPLSITKERELVIDFTMPYLENGYKMLMKRPEYHSPSVFQCFAPLRPLVWLMIAIAILLISVTVTCIHYFGPKDYVNEQLHLLPNYQYGGLPSEQDIRNWVEDNKADIKALNLSNSVWSTLSAFLQQGTNYNPRSLPLRFITAIWWLACTIIISTYTANLAAFLTVNRLDPEITSLLQLSQQHKIKYGLPAGGSIHNHFRTLNYTPYPEMRPHLKLVNNTNEGIKAAKKGGFVFLYDASTLNYLVTQDCSLITTGQEFIKSSHALGLPPNSRYTTEITLGILNLRVNGFITKGLERWYGSKRCQNADQSPKANYQTIGVEHLAGVFLIILCGIVISWIILVIQWYIAAYRNFRSKSKGNMEHMKSKNILEASRRRFDLILLILRLMNASDSVVTEKQTAVEV